MLTALLLLASTPSDSLQARIAANDAKLVAVVSRPLSGSCAACTQAQIDSGFAAYVREHQIEVAR